MVSFCPSEVQKATTFIVLYKKRCGEFKVFERI